jgi:hypothetical protein
MRGRVPMHKRKPYRCPACGAEVPDLPMKVLVHQMSHVPRRPFAGDRRELVQHDHERRTPPTPAPDMEQS